MGYSHFSLILICMLVVSYSTSTCNIDSTPFFFSLVIVTGAVNSFHLGVLEKVGVEPQIQRLGKYKSAGDQLARKSMSKEVREMLTSLLENIYGNWLDTIALTHGTFIWLV